MSNDIVKVSNITKIFNVYRKDIQKIKCVLFGRKPSEVLVALEDVSFTLEKGERLAIIGPVGSGRSTLLNILSGISLPSKGKVVVPESINPMLNNKAGLEMEFSCRDNIYLKAALVDIPKDVVDEHMDEIIEFVEIEDFIDLPMKRASKGAPALMSLAVHLLKKSDLLLVDEVFGGGGNISKTKGESWFRQYLEENEDVSAIIVSNHVNYIKDICSRAIVLDKGKLIYDGSVEEATRLFKTINV